MTGTPAALKTRFDITLDNANNNFGTVTIVKGLNVALNDSNGIILGDGDISGTLNVTASAVS